MQAPWQTSAKRAPRNCCWEMRGVNVSFHVQRGIVKAVRDPLAHHQTGRNDDPVYESARENRVTGPYADQSALTRCHPRVIDTAIGQVPRMWRADQHLEKDRNPGIAGQPDIDDLQEPMTAPNLVFTIGSQDCRRIHDPSGNEKGRSLATGSRAAHSGQNPLPRNGPKATRTSSLAECASGHDRHGPRIPGTRAS